MRRTLGRDGGRQGTTLVELMVAVAIIAIGFLGLVGAFSGITKGIQHSKTRTLSANPLTLEKIEVLKKISYHKLLVSTATLNATEGTFTFEYDKAGYPSETIVIGDLPFIRRVLVQKVQNVGSTFSPIAASGADTGVKKITVYTIWKQDGKWEKYEGSTFYANPNITVLNSSISGTVAGNLADVQVTAQESPNYSALTNAAGDYSMAIPAGSYTLRASKRGYYPAYSSLVVVPSGSNVPDQDFTLTQIGSGTVRGTVWISTYPLISQVVATSGTVNGYEQEFVELYNPTTYAWTLNATTLDLVYRQQGGGAVTSVPLTFHTATLPSMAFYLIASTSPLAFNGAAINADATYSGCTIPCDVIADNADGGVGIRRGITGGYYDRLAWKKNTGPDPPAALTEGTAISAGSGGLGEEEALVRMTSTGAYSSTLGNAYDTDDNSVNFFYLDPTSTIPRNSGTTSTAVSGRPATWAVVSADDGLSSATQAVRALGGGLYEHAYFTLTNVATGTWSVSVASGTAYRQMTGVVVAQGAATDAPNAATSSPWPSAGHYALRLDTTTSSGFIQGKVTNVSGTGLNGITVRTSDASALTDADGKYTLTVATGSLTVEANPSDSGGYNTGYVSQSSVSVAVLTGQITAGLDFALANAGSVTGRITNNGTDPLPDIPVIASRDGVEHGQAVSAADGNFTFTGLSTGSYNVIPQVDTGESVTPSSPTVAVTVGANVWSATFTLTGAMGAIAGTVKVGGVPIKTGVLIAATTGTIASDPPTNGSTLRSGSVLYYAIASLSDGTYRLEVRGGTGTYNVYAWYTTLSAAGAATTTRRTGSATVAAGGSGTVDFTW